MYFAVRTTGVKTTGRKEMMMNTEETRWRTPRFFITGFAATVVCIHTLLASNLSGEEIRPGDRHLGERLVFPAEVFLHNNPEGRVIDVTKPPFNAKGDGVTDDTEALIAAIDYVYSKKDFSVQSWYATARSSAYVIYIPNGTYLVSDTIVSSWPALICVAFKKDPVMDEHIIRLYAEDDQLERQGIELNQWIHIYGESRDGTILRLKDNSPGFEEGQVKPVISFSKTLRGSNSNFSNFLENMTVDTGSGNPGAAGVRWNGSNYGGVRNVTVRSGDGDGYAGLLYDRKHAAGYHRDITVQGFDRGLIVSGGNATSFALEFASFLGQKERAIEIDQGSRISARKLKIDTAGSAVKVAGGFLVLLDSELKAGSGQPAVEIAGPVFIAGKGLVQTAHGFVRNVDVLGTEIAVARAGTTEVEGSRIGEFVSGQAVSLSDTVPARSLNLEIRETPRPPVADDLSQWAIVEAYGAAGDGVTDDTAAIQRAVDSGKPVLFFGRAEYVINGTVHVPASVQQIQFMHSHAVRVVPSDPGMFRISETSDTPLWILKNENIGGVFVDHDADRPLVMEDMWARYVNHDNSYTSIVPRYTPKTLDNNQWRPYRNTRPDGMRKTLFVNNIFNFSPGGVGGQYAPENVNIWARHVNPEQTPTMVAYRNSNVWIFSFKTETNPDLPIYAKDCTMEILGGVVNQMHGSITNHTPMIRSIDSRVSVVLTALGGSNLGPYPVVLEDTKDGSTLTVELARFSPYRANPLEPVIPLLSNQRDSSGLFFVVESK